MIPDDLVRQSKFQSLTRIGFVARGSLYIVIAMLLIATGRTEDVAGAIDFLGRGDGRILLIVLTVGLAAYGLWRLADAALGMESGRHHWRAVGRRLGSAFIAAAYLYVAQVAARASIAGHARAEQPADAARVLLNLPGGAWMLGAAALVLAVAGIVQLIIAASCGFMKPLAEEADTAVVRWLGRTGYAARGIIFLAAALLLARAAMAHRAGGAGGMEQALDLLWSPLQFAVAVGLVLFGAFSMVEARYRRIHHPPVGHVAEKLVEKLREARPPLDSASP
ncbi:MAG: DUF1206 domain-containing protein [Sphingomicrobium sp.]